MYIIIAMILIKLFKYVLSDIAKENYYPSIYYNNCQNLFIIIFIIKKITIITTLDYSNNAIIIINIHGYIINIVCIIYLFRISYTQL